MSRINQDTQDVYMAERIIKSELDIANELGIDTVDHFGSLWFIGKELRWGRLTDIQEYIDDKVVNEEWYLSMLKRYGKQNKRIVVSDSNTNRPQLSSTDSTYHVKIPNMYEQKRQLVVAHEIAHIFSSGHSVKFRSAYQEVVSNMMSEQLSRLLSIYITQVSNKEIEYYGTNSD